MNASQVALTVLIFTDFLLANASLGSGVISRAKHNSMRGSASSDVQDIVTHPGLELVWTNEGHVV
jgi:hypothetical protein